MSSPAATRTVLCAALGSALAGDRLAPVGALVGGIIGAVGPCKVARGVLGVLSDLNEAQSRELARLLGAVDGAVR